MNRGTTWRDAWGEFVPAFLSFAVPAFVALATGLIDALGDAVTEGAHLDHKLYVDGVLSILVGALGAGFKVIAYRLTTTRGVNH